MLGTHQATEQSWKNSCNQVVFDALTSIGGDHGPSDALFDATYVVPFLGLDQTGAVDPDIAGCGDGGSGSSSGSSSGGSSGASSDCGNCASSSGASSSSGAIVTDSSSSSDVSTSSGSSIGSSSSASGVSSVSSSSSGGVVGSSSAGASSGAVEDAGGSSTGGAASSGTGCGCELGKRATKNHGYSPTAFVALGLALLGVARKRRRAA